MEWVRFKINAYKAVKDSRIAISRDVVPIIGINESGKTSVLEAIAHVDHRNDQIADSRPWSFINRYQPNEQEFSVEAEVSFSGEEAAPVLDKFNDEEKSKIKDLFQSGKKLILLRIFSVAPGNPRKRWYRIGAQEDDLVNRFAVELINRLPRVLFIDNFLENPFPETVEFPAEYVTNPAIQLDQYQLVYEAMFRQAGTPLQDYLASSDSLTRETYLANVSKHVTEKVIADWESMRVNPEDPTLGDSLSKLKIILRTNPINPLAIDVKVEEEFTNKQGQITPVFTSLNERSLGFRWYFHFSVRKCFGASGGTKFLYLIDEPGSFLHNTAQEVLLKAISELSREHPTIFSTHSEFLLDPEIININNVKVVEKTHREIRLVPLAETSDRRDKGALSPLFRALRTRASLASTLNQKVIVTEGITDFYFWRMLIEKVVFLPGFGAGQNRVLLSTAIGSADKYLAFFDGDDAGDRAVDSYKLIFGEEEGANWKKYVDNAGRKVKLERLLSKKDQKRLQDLTGASDLKKGITILFYSDKKKEFWNSVDDDSRKNIARNLAVIKKHLGLTGQFNFKF